MRKDEYKKHPLYKILDQYTDELEEFITKKRQRHTQMRAAAEKFNLGPDTHYNPITGTYVRTSSMDPFRMQK